MYLSSYRLGLYPADLVRMAGGRGARTALIGNAIDQLPSDVRQVHNQTELASLKGIGLDAFELDLRDYFTSPQLLPAALSDAQLVWVRGGNTFVLRRAMSASGLDEIVQTRVPSGAIAYGGYSAGVCVLAPTLRGLDTVDDPVVVPEGYEPETPWEGLSLLGYSVAPHFRSDHPESNDVDKEVAYFESAGLPYKTLRDGEVILIENGSEVLKGF